MANMAGVNTVAIIGSGIIGRNWAMVFLSGGCKVRLYDKDPSQVEEAIKHVRTTLSEYETGGIIRGSLSAKEQGDNLTATVNMADCVKNADFVLECVPETLELKRAVFQEFDNHVKDNAILSSTTAGIFPSKISEGLKHKNHVIVTHPLNPPYFLPFTEVVPAPWTEPDISERTIVFLKELGQEPVLLKKETEGFIVNRVQHTLTAECWKLVRVSNHDDKSNITNRNNYHYKDGVVTAEDVDKVMPYGLGRRYTLLGVLEASHLNAHGIKDFCDRYAENLYKLQFTFGPPVKFDGETLEKIHNDIASRVPVDKIPERSGWRDKSLAALDQFLKQNQKENDV